MSSVLEKNITSTISSVSFIPENGVLVNVQSSLSIYAGNIFLTILHEFCFPKLSQLKVNRVSLIFLVTPRIIW